MPSSPGYSSKGEAVEGMVGKYQMTIGYEVAKASKEQMVDIAEVFQISREQALPYLPELHNFQETIDYFTNVVFPENDVYIALNSESKKIVGFIAFTKTWVNHLYLLAEAQNRSLGGKLLRLAKDQSEILELWTFQKNSTAQHFYKKHGFKVIKTTDGSENQEKEPDILLRWEK